MVSRGIGATVQLRLPYAEGAAKEGEDDEEEEEEEKEGRRTRRMMRTPSTGCPARRIERRKTQDQAAEVAVGIAGQLVCAASMRLPLGLEQRIIGGCGAFIMVRSLFVATSPRTSQMDAINCSELKVVEVVVSEPGTQQNEVHTAEVVSAKRLLPQCILHSESGGHWSRPSNGSGRASDSCAQARF